MQHPDGTVYLILGRAEIYVDCPLPKDEQGLWKICKDDDYLSDGFFQSTEWLEQCEPVT